MVKRLTSLRCPKRSTAPRASSLETPISDATISRCSATSSVRPCAACTASSTVGGLCRTRRRPSFVSHMSLICHLFCYRACLRSWHTRRIISHLPHCNKEIVQCTHKDFNDCDHA